MLIAEAQKLVTKSHKRETPRGKPVESGSVAQLSL